MDTRGNPTDRRTRAARLLTTGGLAVALLLAPLAATSLPASATDTGPAPAEAPVLTWTTYDAAPVVDRVASRSVGDQVRRYGVETSDANLGRIRTAPDGTMWFTMVDVNKVGRITTQGKITEYALPETTTGTNEGTYDLAIASDGTIWVVYDFGRRILGFTVDAAGTPTIVAHSSLGSSPYGEQVAVDPANIPWVSMDFDESGLARVINGQAVWLNNAPPCDGAIAWGSDGAMWCQSDDRLIRSHADASGGLVFPIDDSIADPYSLAAGPTGSIWFARYDSPTWVSSPDEGDVGWIDHRNGQVRIINTGDETAPFSLTRGPDNKMWFTSIGREHAIGHVDARGRGALTKIGNLEPHYLTFAKTGDIWFTDKANNSIVAIAPKHLKVTNMDPGEGSVFTRSASVGRLTGAAKPLKVARNRVPVRIACPKGAGTCRGKVVLQHAKKGQTWSKKASYAVKPGKKKTVRLALTRAGQQAIKRKPAKARVVLAGGGTRTVKKVKVRR